MGAENTRELVLDILLSLDGATGRPAEQGRVFSHRLIKAVLDKYDYLDARDKSFIKRLAEGTIERQIELDYYLNQVSSVPVCKMKPLIRCLLRMSAYQLLYMDSVPDSAVCNEACRLAGKRKFQNLKGFVNGVLRNLAKQKNHIPLPDRSADEAAYYSVKYSMPGFLVELWRAEYGSAVTETLLEGLMAVHSVQLRFRTDLSDKERDRLLGEMKAAGAALTQSRYLPYLYTVENAEGIGSLPGFAQGAFTVQDVSSALCVEAAGIRPGDFVMDICAAPGGKTLLAAERTGEGGSVLSRDVSEAKLALLQENLDRMKCSNVTVQVYDATQTDERYLNQADVVLLDVPCSGLGVMGKKRDIKYHVTPEGLEELGKLQRRIVESSWQYVKPGGILLYSTCTVHRAENQDMVRWILERFPFEPVPLKDSIPQALREDWSRCGMAEDESDACIQLLPGYMEADGFFFAKLRRREDARKNG